KVFAREFLSFFLVHLLRTLGDARGIYHGPAAPCGDTTGGNHFTFDFSFSCHPAGDTPHRSEWALSIRRGGGVRRHSQPDCDYDAGDCFWLCGVSFVLEAAIAD